jgi:prepilin-type N-terminal cleavage/methylation domain-containing protein/prepilin-type processing-associated H-X9-DG protein
MRRAFTLIELLVVIAIIAILAAILFPVFSQAKAAAKKTADLNNHKQIITSMYMYASDNDDRTCATHHDLETGETIADLYTWFEPLYPYCKNRDIFRDQVVSQTPTLFPNLLTLPDWNVRRTDYLINGFFSHGTSFTIFSSPANQIVVGERHSNIAFFDYHAWPSAPDDNWERGFLDGSGYQLGDVDTDTQVPDARNVGRHAQGNNYSFSDGHAKWFRFTQTLDKTKPADAIDNWGMHNVDNLPAND